jgi:hypothetical protein
MGMPDPNITAAIARSTPVGRTGVPDDIAAACAWLTSEEAAWVTGPDDRAQRRRAHDVIAAHGASRARSSVRDEIGPNVARWI